MNLRQDNLAFRGTTGVSENNRDTGFVPAFRQDDTGRIELARLKNGKVAPAHIISWLPTEWADSIGDDGTVEGLIPGIVAGFVRDGRFYTREEAACA